MESKQFNYKCSKEEQIKENNDINKLKYTIIHDIKNFNFNKEMINDIRNINKDDIIDILMISIEITEYLKIVLLDN